MDKEIETYKVQQIRKKYEAHLWALSDYVGDAVPLKFRVAYVKSKLRLFDACFCDNKKRIKRGKMKISKADYFRFYEI